MLWALVVALFALAIAAATTLVSRYQIAQLRSGVIRHATDLEAGIDAELKVQQAKRKEADVAICELKRRLTELEMTAEPAGHKPGAADASDGAGGGQVPAQIDEIMTERDRQAAALRQWADVHFTAAAGDAAQSAQLLHELSQYAVNSLEHEATSARPGSLILRCGLYAQQPSVLDIGPVLVDELRSALKADLMYRQAHGPNGVRFYLRWPKDVPSPRPKLESLLRTAIAAGDGGTAEQGTTQLQAVLRALHDGGPAVLQLGPLLVARTENKMAAGFVSADWPGMDDDQRAAAIAGTQPDLLTDLGASEFADLSSWGSS